MALSVGILGLGTVGSGVVQILLTPEGRSPLLQGVKIAKVGVRDRQKIRSVTLAPEIYTDDLESIVSDPAIDVVIEVMGGLEPARSLILKAIAHKKSVITANKAVLARFGDEIFTLAKAHGVYVMLEAAVAGVSP